MEVSVDVGVMEASGVGIESSVNILPLWSKVVGERQETVAEEKNGGGESKTSPESKLTSRSVVAGVSTLKPSHTSDVLF